jgi:2'-hydroxyisoflavone reductase
MRILIVGGTRFVGRHIAATALAAGHELTLLHRGRTGASLFPEAEHVLADRNSDLSQLTGKRWDATIDVSAYFPHQVDSLASALEGNGGHYVFISSVSAYAAPPAPGFAESSPLRMMTGPVPTSGITAENYGPLKVLCERAAIDHFGQSTLIVRPTYVIGPHDHSGRFTYWVHRLARGGEVLAPGLAESPIQLVDARDMATWIVDLVQAQRGGAFHAVAPWQTFADMLAAIASEVSPEGTRLSWRDPEFLLRHGVDGEALPLWAAGDEEDALLNTADPAAAIAAGLRNRPLAESIRDVLRLEPPPDHLGFLTRERESELLRMSQ